jgi:UDP-galactopyranose mutase
MATVCDVLVVGAGFAGAIMAERLADAGERVVVIDRRPHIAGNAYDHRDDYGVLVHRYGPHLFHTNSDRVVAYLSRFTDWVPYEHRVQAVVDGRHLPIPINRTTLNMRYGLSLSSSAEAEAFLAARAEPVAEIRNSEDAVVAKVGRDLYEAFFRGYTRKQWNRDPAQLNASVCGRIPVRFDEDDRYFTDSHQALPADGYTAMFERILDHPRISVRCATDFADVRETLRWGRLVWTGPIDEYFAHRLGVLPYRSLRFDFVPTPTEAGRLVQPVAQVNYPDQSVPYTRITEFAHLYGQRPPMSTLAYEYPAADGPPYYPVPAPENQELYRRYAELAAEESAVTFVGRLATYKYLNMDQVVSQALVTFDNLAATGTAARLGA